MDALQRLFVLCWLTGSAVSQSYAQNHSSFAYNTTWKTAIIPKERIHVPSNTGDPALRSSNMSTVGAYLNSVRTLTVCSRWSRTSAAMALCLKPGDNTTMRLSPQAENRFGNRLAVASIGLVVDTIHASLQIGSVLHNRLSYGSKISFFSKWVGHRWLRSFRATSYFVLPREGI